MLASNVALLFAIVIQTANGQCASMSSHCYLARNDSLLVVSYESIELTYLEMHYFKCGLFSWYTCIGYRQRVRTATRSYHKSVLSETSPLTCNCTDGDECSDYDLRFNAPHNDSYQPGTDRGDIQACLNGQWYYIDFDLNSTSAAVICHDLGFSNSTTAIFKEQLLANMSYLRLQCSGEEKEIHFCEVLELKHSNDVVGHAAYLQCYGAAECSVQCVNGQCSLGNICICNQGWTGRVCDVAECSPSCHHGRCNDTNTCLCDDGWVGNLCHQAVCSKGCLNGQCNTPGVCECNAGYIGDSCSTKTSIFTVQPEQFINKVAGEDVTLSCSTSGEPAPELTWIFSDNTTIKELMETEQLSINYLRTGSEAMSNLTIRDIRLNHVGIYACLAANETYSQASTVEIEYPTNVTVFPEIIIAPEPLVMEKFTCEGFGIPLPELVWYKDDEYGELDQENYTINEQVILSPLGYLVAISELVFEDFDNYTEGNYICQGYNNVTNNIGASDEGISVFYLEESPSVHSNATSVSSLLGKSVYLTFDVTYGLPEAENTNITWTVTQAHEYKLLSLNTSTKYQFKTNPLSLVINNINYNDEGLYNLTICNRGGCGTTAIHLVVEAAPVIQSISPDVDIISPATIELACEALGKPQPNVYWLFNDRVVSDKRAVSNNLTLNISSFDQSGHYSCIAENKHNETSKTVGVNVQEPPLILIDPEDMTIYISQTAEFTCTASGYPLPDIVWIKDGEELNTLESEKYDLLIEIINYETEINTTLIVNEIDPNDEGLYWCKANNTLIDLLEEISVQAILDVFYPPAVVTGLLDSVKVANDSITFFCNFTGNPTPDVTWYKTNSFGFGLIFPSNRITICVSEIDLNIGESSLKIVNLKKDDEGTYMCKGFNNASDFIESNDSSQAYLTILVPPFFIEQPDSFIIEVAGDFITLECIFGGYPTPNITWTRIINGSVISLEETEFESFLNHSISNFTIEELQLNDTGVYSCSASNLVGIITTDVHLSIHFPAKVSVFPELLIAPEPNASEIFTCNGFGVPPPLLMWFRINGDFLSENVTVQNSTEISTSGVEMAVSTLTFHEFKNSTEGIYECHGYNNVTDLLMVNDSAKAVFLLATAPKFETPDTYNLTALSGTMITINFTITHATPMVDVEDIIWYFQPSFGSKIQLLEDERIEFGDDMLELNLYNLSEADSGIYNVTASNRVGTGYASVELLVETEPKIDLILAVTNVISPMQLALTCLATGIPIPAVRWLYSGLPLVEYSYGTNNHTVKIKSVDNAGNYTCEARNENGQVLKSIDVKVQDPPVFISSPLDTNGTAHDSVMLNCTVYGYPLPDIDWIKDGSILNESDSSGSDDKYYIWDPIMSDDFNITSAITIDMLSYDDNGEYQCMAYNVLFQTESAVSNVSTVDVKYPPEIRQGLISLTINESDSLQLNCTMTGTPLPEIIWLKNEAFLDLITTFDERTKINFTTYSVARISNSVLTITDVDKSDEGVYRCLGNNSVENNIGAVNYSEANVTVQVPPSIQAKDNTTILQRVVGHDEFVAIEFKIWNDYPAVIEKNIIWQKSNESGIFFIYRIQNKYSFSHSQNLLNISKLSYADRGNYTIIATNEAGSTQSSIELNLEVQPQLFTSTGRNVSFNSTGGSVTFNCSADGIPRPDLLWYRNGILLLNISRFHITYSQDQDHTRYIRFNTIPEVEQASSNLTITNLRSADSGNIECRADNYNSAGQTVNVMNYLEITDSFIPHCAFPGTCANGKCYNTMDRSFYCECEEGFSGIKCNERVVFVIPARLLKITYTTGTESTMTQELYTQTNVSVFLYSRLTLTCHSDGIPLPKTTWVKINDEFPVIGSSLVFEEFAFSNRGFYKCIVCNTLDCTVESKFIQLTAKGVLQYRMRFDVSNTLVEPIVLINGALSGSKVDEITILSVEKPSNIAKRSASHQIQSIVSILANAEGNNELSQTLFSLVSDRLKQKLPNVFPISELPFRFDGCVSEETLVPSISGNRELVINITWPETNLGESVVLGCPCGGLDLGSSSLIATRKCGGNYISGAKWEEPFVDPCNFTDKIRQLCLLALKPPIERVESLQTFTESANEFKSTEVTVSVAVVLSATPNITGDVNNTESFLTVIDDLLKPTKGILQESQQTANTSARMLEAIEFVTEELPIENGVQIIALDTFAVSLQKVNTTVFTGARISATINDAKMPLIEIDELQMSDTDYNQSAEIILPQNIFDFASNVSRRVISSAVFVNDALFLRRDKRDKEVASVILSASLVGSDSITGLNDSAIQLSFISNSSVLENASTPQCSFWNSSLDDGYGDWSTLGCHLVNTTLLNESEIVLYNCQCDHLTSFSILLDVSYKVPPTPPDRPVPVFLSVYTYIGCIISIICLIVTVLSYTLNRKLLRSEPGQLIINLSLSLIGLYFSFIAAIHSTSSHVMCALVSAFLQYFFLVAFMVMAAEAVSLYMKTVIVFATKIRQFALKAYITCWVLPFLIVAFCIAPDYDYYINSFICRVDGIPFYVGTVFPFFIVYIFNWCMFMVIYVSILKNHSSILSGDGKSSSTHRRIAQVKSRLRIAVGLSVFFGLGWGLGVPATQLQKNQISRYVFSFCFNSLTAFQGFFIFILHCIKKQEVRKEWGKWLACLLCRSHKGGLSFTSQSNSKNANIIQKTDLTACKNTSPSPNVNLRGERIEETSPVCTSDHDKCFSKDCVLQDLTFQGDNIIVLTNQCATTSEMDDI